MNGKIKQFSLDAFHQKQYEKIKMSHQEAANYVKPIVFYWPQHYLTFLLRKKLDASGEVIIILPKETPTASHIVRMLPYKHYITLILHRFKMLIKYSQW